MSAHVLPQAIARSRRIDFRVVTGLLLFVVGIVATSAQIDQASERTAVLVAAHALDAGHTITAEDLRVAELGLTHGVATVGAGELDAVVGQVLRASVEPGQVLAPAALAAAPSLGPDQVAISIGVAGSHAAGGRLAPGDKVMLIATSDPDRGRAKTTVLLRSVEVIAIDREQGPGATPDLTVTLTVAARHAAAVAQAYNSGILDLALLPVGGSW